MSQEFAGFMSYVRIDDAHESGRLTELCSRISGEVGIQLGHEFPIFQDRNDISWGQQWEKRIEESIDATTILIPIITPSFFRSPPCRSEVERFLAREKELGRFDLILPIYYVNCPILTNELSADADQIVKIIASRQFADWRELRFDPFTAPAIGKTIASLAAQIVRTLEAVRSESTPRAINAGAKQMDQQKGAENSRIHRGGVSIEDRPKSETKKNEPRTLIVDALHRGDHFSLREAVGAAQSGDRILVRPGFYRESILIDKAIEIIGDGDLGEVVIESTDKGTIVFQANMGRIINLTLRNTGTKKYFCIAIGQGRLDLEGCDITSKTLSGVAIFGGADPRLRRNRFHDCKESGVFVFDNGLGTLEDNEVFNNGLAGVAIKTGGNPILRRNRLYDGKQSGIHVYEDGSGTFEDNEIFNNSLAGVSVKVNGNPTLRRNRIYGGKQSGVGVFENGLGTFEDNEIFGNNFSNIIVRSGGNPSIRRNKIYNSKQHGLYVLDKGLGAIEDNSILNNGRAGIFVETEGNPTLFRNIINGNTYEAVWIKNKGGGRFVENDLRDNGMGAIDVSDECKKLAIFENNLE